MVSDLEMSWKPFGLTLTYGEWDKLVAWYVEEYVTANLDNKEEHHNAVELYSQKLDSWTY